MNMRLAVVMDPIASIHYQKDSTLAMLFEAKARGYTLFYIEQHNLFLADGLSFAHAYPLDVFKDPKHWYALGAPLRLNLSSVDVILMRKDPPVDEHYIYATYILEQAEQSGTLVVNRPQALRDANEKLFTSFFPAFCPPTLVSASINDLYAFWRQQGEIVCKPLNGMGGASVFCLKQQEMNAAVIFAQLTANGTKCVMAQKYLPAIQEGDKRILLIDGKPLSHALARIPQGEDWRGNLAVGAKGVAVPLSARDQEICAALGPHLSERGLYFVGLDIIGDYLTEINVTSPTGICELDRALNMNICGQLMDKIETLC
jgi:glutathione synthase